MQNANQINQIVSDETAARLRTAGVAGAGGAGFPSYAKWQDPDGVDYLLVNHQESEPVFYCDAWMLENFAEEFANLFEDILSEMFDVVVVATKEKYREEWMAGFEEASADADVFAPDELPLDADQLSGVTLAYTEDKFQFGMEQVLLNFVCDTVIGNDLPTDHGWVVHNTETVYNIYRALTEGTPVTDKYVHVCGDVDQHRFLKVPVGTPGSDLLEAAGAPPVGSDEEGTLLTGGPGWCFEADESPEEFAVGRHTNGLLVADDTAIEENTLGDGRIDLLDTKDWKGGDHETEPSSYVPEVVRIGMITNDAYEGLVEPSTPVVQPGHDVSRGELIAAPADGLSIARHASIPGTVTEVTDAHVQIERTE